MTKQRLIKLVKQSYDIHGVEEFYDELNYTEPESEVTWIEVIERWNWFHNTRRHCVRSIMRAKRVVYYGSGTYEITYDDNFYQRDIYKIYSKNIKFSKNIMEYKRRR